MEIDNSIKQLLNKNSFMMEIKKEIKDSLDLNESILYPNMRHNEYDAIIPPLCLSITWFLTMPIRQLKGSGDAHL